MIKHSTEGRVWVDEDRLRWSMYCAGTGKSYTVCIDLSVLCVQRYLFTTYVRAYLQRNLQTISPIFLYRATHSRTSTSD